MVNKETAIQIKKRALNAVSELTTILSEVNNRCSDEDYMIIKRGVGLSIGNIQMELLEPIYHQHPEIDDLRE